MDPSLKRAQLGMTLIELMIVVAIIGILASIAVFMFTRATGKARASEVPAVFAEIRIRQEGFHMENGRYQTTSTDTTGLLPADTPATSASGGTVVPDPLPAAWAALNFKSDKNTLFCSYGTIGGVPTDTPSGAIATAFSFTGSPTNWFYMFAYCDLDGDGGTNSTYYGQSGNDGQAVLNEGN